MVASCSWTHSFIFLFPWPALLTSGPIFDPCLLISADPLGMVESLVPSRPLALLNQLFILGFWTDANYGTGSPRDPQTSQTHQGTTCRLHPRRSHKASPCGSTKQNLSATALHQLALSSNLLPQPVDHLFFPPSVFPLGVKDSHAEAVIGDSMLTFLCEVRRDLHMIIARDWFLFCD